MAFWSAMMEALGDHTNWTIKDNILEDYGYYGFELTNASNSTIQNNIIHATPADYSNTCIMVDARRYESGITIQGNQIDGQLLSGFTYDGVQYGGWAAVFIFANDFETPNVNLNNVTVENNAISATGITTAGTTTLEPSVWVYRYTGAGTVTNVQVNDNSLLSMKNTKSTSNTVPIGVLDASANWWGSSVAASVATAAGANVDYTPWLNNGTDTDTSTPGFRATSLRWMFPQPARRSARLALFRKRSTWSRRTARSTSTTARMPRT